MAMQIYSRYIIRHLTIPFIVITLILSGIVWLTQSLRFIDLIVNRGLSVGTFVYFSALLLPSLLMIILPVALFVSVLFVYNRLIADSEIIVFNSTGLSRIDLTKPALIVAAFAVAFGYLLSFYLLPLSYREFKDLQLFIRNNYASVLLQEEVFSTPIPGLTVYVESRQKGGYLEGILVHDSRNPDNPVTYLAKKGRLEKTANGPQMVLMDADAQKLNVKNHNLEVLYFDHYPLNLSTFIHDEGDRMREAEEMGVHELLFPPAELDDATRTRLMAEGHNRVIWPLYAITLTMVALAGLLFGQFNRRGYWKKNVMISVCGLVLLVCGLLMKGVASSHLGLWWVMYLPLALFTGGSAYIMVMRRQPDITRLKKKALKSYARLKLHLKLKRG